LINSTAGMAALHHGVPTIACGSAIYDLPGLTYQGSLDDFWAAAPGSAPDPFHFRRFRRYVIERTQLNGSFYKPLRVAGTRSGLVWPRATTLSAAPQTSAAQREPVSQKLRPRTPSLTP
jgi:capsular polysaccharide export protein